MELINKYPNLKPWPKGISGNPNGRAPGTRIAFSKAYIADFQQVWSESGLDAIRRVAAKSPEQFGFASRLIPADLVLARARARSQAPNPEIMFSTSAAHVRYQTDQARRCYVTVTDPQQALSVASP